ncbi:MAG TPA: hypothetical protein VM779_11535 [Thermoanaerobaculia bacterium]|nr:hypothetical protein [Thermoanaerobaculia bacterium]
MLRGVRAAGRAALLLIATVALDAAERVWFVPWKVLGPGMPAEQALFVLYWIPASPDDLKRSDLVTSRALAIYSSRCVAMHVVRVDDSERIENFGEPELPVALLADGDREIARLHGAVRASEVEAMVQSAFAAREAKAVEALDAARECLRNGDKRGAAALFERVIEQRCSFPRQARAAEKALRRLKSR